MQFNCVKLFTKFLDIQELLLRMDIQGHSIQSLFYKYQNIWGSNDPVNLDFAFIKIFYFVNSCIALIFDFLNKASK